MYCNIVNKAYHKFGIKLGQIEPVAMYPSLASLFNLNRRFLLKLTLNLTKGGSA